MDRSVAPLRPMTKPMQSPGTVKALKSFRVLSRLMVTGPTRCCRMKSM